MDPIELPPESPWIIHLISVVFPWFGKRVALLTLELAPLDLRLGVWFDPTPHGTLLVVSLPTFTVSLSISTPHDCADHG